MENKRKLSFRRASFVKVLDDNFIEKLEMPPSFVNIFEGDIPPWLILEISGSRKCWRVDVEDDENGRVYLSYGFNCFIKAHSLEAGNFLLFEYEKPSILQVKIYEKDGSERANESTLELEYEIRASESPKQTPKIHEGKPSESPRQTSIIHVGGNAESPRQPPIVDDVSETPRQSQIIREVGPFESAKQSMKVHEEVTPWTSLPCKSRIQEGERCESPRQPPITHEGEHAETPRPLSKIREVGRSEFLRQPPRVQEKEEATPWPTVPSIRYRECEIQRNGINNTKRKKCMMTSTGQNACFSLTWRKASHFLYYVTIPKPMLVDKTYSNKETVLLKDTEGNSWQMELRVRQDGRVDLAKGWREFVNNCDLMTGDVLIFEFLSNNMIQVQIVRANQAGNPSEREQDRKIEPKLFDTRLTVGNARVASEIKSSSFSVTWSLLSRNTYLNIPKAIAIKQKLVDKDTVVLCDPEGRKWSIEVRTRPSDGRIGLGHGLSDFLKAYEIDVGDTLIFEFVTERMIKVHIIKACGLNHFVSGASVKQELMNLDLPMEVGPWLIHDAPEDLNHV